MSNKLDIHSQFSASVSMAPFDITGNTENVGATIDTQGCDGIEFIAMAGVLADADATFPVTLWESDDSGMSGEAQVTDANLLYGTPPAWTYASDGAIAQFGYRGSKRYLRVKITPAANSGSAPFSVACIKRLKKVGSTL